MAVVTQARATMTANRMIPELPSRFRTMAVSRKVRGTARSKKREVVTPR